MKIEDLLDEATTVKLQSVRGSVKKKEPKPPKRGHGRVTASHIEYLREKARVLRLREAGISDRS